jgi:type III pantothenate kinase
MGRLLLVGNSRWHWAQRLLPSGSESRGLHCWHESAPPAANDGWSDLEAWAAVGPLPAGLALPAQRRVGLKRVPLAEMPDWLGVDRALAGWQAWRSQGHGVLVADAGTCLSLTWVDGQGRFRGGRLSAGLGLQLRSLGAATVALPELPQGPAGLQADDPGEAWPMATAAAMLQGCLRACAASIAQACLDVGDEEPCCLWLTGGDGACLLPLLQRAGLKPELAPDLCLQALATLAETEPGPPFS